ncbi:MAG TPA: DMT family transporter [Pyrinomonadaceae bacterium]|nr:DMT family transporter [Pyrinomonadaceae bacterium]
MKARLHLSNENDRKGPILALIAAALFGASAPLAKLLLNQLPPILLAALLYLGSGIGLSVWLWWRRSRSAGKSSEARLKRQDLPWLGSAILAGGILGPILLLIGLRLTPASSASLLLNLEGAFTALLAWFVFKENFDRRIALGMAAIVAGGVLLSWAGRPEFGIPWGTIFIAGACLAWAIDNNLTRKVSSADPIQIATAKGLIAGVINLSIAFVVGMTIPRVEIIASAALLGFLSYGVSLTLFVLALRHIGTARTGAYFSTAPFVGALLSLLIFRDHLTIAVVAAAGLMVIGVWLHLTERHGHEHLHEEMEHEHRHAHDQHHQHHSDPALLAQTHTHTHRHERLRHAHSHYPDIHHRHEHQSEAK